MSVTTSQGGKRSIFAGESTTMSGRSTWGSPQQSKIPTIGNEDEDLDLIVKRTQMDRRMEEARESSKRSLQKLDNTMAVGVDTMVELDRQGEQLRRARHQLDNLEPQMKESDWLLRGMGSWFGALYNKVATSGPGTSPSATSSTSSFLSPSSSTRNEPTSRQTRPVSAPPTSATSISSLLVDPEARRFWEETDTHLDQMDERLERLRMLGRDMGRELETQTQEIEELDKKVQQSTESIRERTLKIFRLT